MKQHLNPGILLLGAALVLYPFIFNGAFYVNVGAAILLAAISASAWNLVGGYAGQISVGHGMFFGAGAYAPLLLYQHGGFAPIIGIPVGIVLSLALAGLIGQPAFRLRGHYFSMATIAIAELIRIWISTWDFAGAAMGLQGPAVGRNLWDLTFRDETPYYFIFLGVLCVVLYVTHILQRSRFGSYLRAIRADERAAASLGVSVRSMKMKALLLSAAFTSVAGSLYSIKTGFVDPESSFGILVSVQMVIIAALGGAGTLFGPLVGAIILVTLQTVTNTWAGGGGTGLTYILYGGIIVIIARFEPGGLNELWQRCAHRIRRLRHAS